MNQSSFRRVISIATGIVAVLILAALVGEQSSESSPFSTSSTGKQGTRALFELLQAVGYKVRIDSNATEYVAPGELVVLPYKDSTEINARVRRSAKRGNDLLLLPMLNENDELVPSASPAATTTITNPYSKQTLKVIMNLEAEGPYKAFSSTVAQIDLFTDQNNEYVAVSVAQLDKCRVYSVADGKFVQNRYLAQHDNARLIVDLVRSLKPKGIVISESLIAPSGQSLIRALGPGAEAAWFQLWVLFFIAFSAMSIRFGLPPDQRLAQAGHRSMVSAIANTLKTKGRVQELKDAVRTQFLERQAIRHRTSRQNIEDKPTKFLDPETSNLLTQLRVTEQPNQLVTLAKKLSEE